MATYWHESQSPSGRFAKGGRAASQSALPPPASFETFRPAAGKS